LVRFQTAHATAFENESGLPEEPPFAHTARIALTRVGNLSQSLTCQLSLSGTAAFAVDYFIEGMSESRTVTFPPGKATVWLEVFPILDDLRETNKSAAIKLETATSYAPGQIRHAEVAIYDNALAAWLAARWPQTNAGTAGGFEKQADPDGNGLSNITEFMLGADPRDSRTLVRPEFSFNNGVLQLVATENKLASGLRYSLEQSADMKTWTPAAVTPEIKSESPTRRVLSFPVKTLNPQLFLRLNIQEDKSNP
jgi:hypothetical protein